MAVRAVPDADLTCLRATGVDIARLPAASRQFPLVGQGNAWSIGRQLQQEFFATLVPDEALRTCISRNHFELAWDARQMSFVFKRLSQNLVLINGMQTPQNSPVPLLTGAEIGLCAPQSTTPFLVLCVVLRGVSATPHQSASSESAIASSAQPSQYVFVCSFAFGIIVNQLPRELRTIVMPADRDLIIGRQHQTELFEALFGKQQHYLTLVSRAHLHVTRSARESGLFMIKNLSENPILAGKCQLAKDGQIESLTPVDIHFIAAHEGGTMCFLTLSFVSNGHVDTSEASLLQQPGVHPQVQGITSNSSNSGPMSNAPVVPHDQRNLGLGCTSITLVCVFALGCGDLETLPKEARRINLSFSESLLVGRQHQPGFFERLLAQDQQHLACISRCHFEIVPTRGNGTVFAISNRSENPIIVDQTQLAKGEQAPIQHGSFIMFIAAGSDASTSVGYLRFSVEMRAGDQVIATKGPCIDLGVNRCVEISPGTPRSPQAGPGVPRSMQAGPGTPRSMQADALFWLELGGSLVRNDFPLHLKRICGGQSGIIVGRGHQSQLHHEAFRMDVASFVSHDHFRVDPSANRNGCTLLLLSNNLIWRVRAGVRTEAKRNEPLDLLNGDVVQLCTGANDGCGTLYWLFYDGTVSLDACLRDNTLRMEATRRMEQQKGLHGHEAHQASNHVMQALATTPPVAPLDTALPITSSMGATPAVATTQLDNNQNPFGSTAQIGVPGTTSAMQRDTIPVPIMPGAMSAVQRDTIPVPMMPGTLDLQSGMQLQPNGIPGSTMAVPTIPGVTDAPLVTQPQIYTTGPYAQQSPAIPGSTSSVPVYVDHVNFQQGQTSAYSPRGLSFPSSAHQGQPNAYSPRGSSLPNSAQPLATYERCFLEAAEAMDNPVGSIGDPLAMSCNAMQASGPTGENCSSATYYEKRITG